MHRVYGAADRKPREYEVDHLISLELGGSNSIKNLWPESHLTKPLNAQIKDRLENKLHQLICSGEIAVEQAQQEIATDWIAAYQKYIGPLDITSQPTVSNTITSLNMMRKQIQLALINNTVKKWHLVKKLNSI